MIGPQLPQAFFARDALDLARALLGTVLVRDQVALRITEVEAYRHPADTVDSANHCRAGRTARTEPMWGPPGHAYVYLCYGIHRMVNVVSDAEGDGAAVLIRAAEPILGHAIIAGRRGGRTNPASLAGPGKVGAALAIDMDLSGHPLFEPGGLELHAGTRPEAVLAGPRIGIDFAQPEHRDAPWRLAIADTPWVSHRKGLKPLA